VAGYDPPQANDGMLEVNECNFAWMDAGGAYGGGAWIQVSFPSAKKVSSMFMDTNIQGTSACAQTGRTFAGGDLQYWNGSTWVTIATITGQTNDWSYSFPQVTTTAMRLYNIYALGGQGSNPIVYEWQLFGCN